PTPSFSMNPVQTVAEPTVLNDMANTMARLEADQKELTATIRQQEEKIKSLEVQLAKEDNTDLEDTSHAGDTKLKATRQALVRSAMKDLLGVDLIGRRLGSLPDPLPRGAAQRTDPCGTKLWNPEWQNGPTMGDVNPQYIKAVLELTRQRGTVEHMADLATVSDDILKSAAYTFFKTLRRQYQAQTTEAGKKRKQTKIIRTRKRGRKHAKCHAMRQQVASFKAIYGEDNTVGVESLLLTDWMSSEDSGINEPDTSPEFQAYRKKQIGMNNSGFEVQALNWRAYELKKIFITLRRLGVENQENNDEGSNRVTRIPRFPGYPGHANDDPPRPAGKKKIKPYRFCVDEAWATRTGNESMILAEEPQNFTIFQLKIPRSAHTKEDLAYLGDDEAAEEDDN
ncbi:hypothetical protein H0H93_001291, partial [Arthromyces matolae]